MILRSKSPGRKDLICLLALFIHSLLSAQDAASGSAGVAQQHAIVNFSVLAQQSAVAAKERSTAPQLPPPLPGNRSLSRNPPATGGLTAVQAPPQEAAPRDTPDLAANFNALDDDGHFIPPDTQGAVGPNHLMVTLNSQIRIQDRVGNALSTVTLVEFWQGVHTGTDVFDPRVLYDPYGKRWIFTVAAERMSADASVLVGVTQTSDPTGNWNLYRFKADTESLVWADFPATGFNKDWIVVSCNMYGVSKRTHGFQRTNLYVCNKADLYASGAGLFTLLQLTTADTVAPARTYDSALSTLYLVDNASPFLRISAISGSVGAEQLSAHSAAATVPERWKSSPRPPAFLPQLGSRQKINGGDDRLLGCVYRNGTLWCVQHVFPITRPKRCAVQWTQFGIDGAILQHGRIDDTTGINFFAYPSIGVNANDDVLIGYSRFSKFQFPSGNYAFRAGTDPLNMLGADRVLKAGEGPLTDADPKSRRAGVRWGDYSASVVDPLNDQNLWTIQEYGNKPTTAGTRWGTWWGKLALVSASANANGP